jgi:hypothetical protein
VPLISRTTALLLDGSSAKAAANGLADKNPKIKQNFIMDNPLRNEFG